MSTWTISSIRSIRKVSRSGRLRPSVGTWMYFIMFYVSHMLRFCYYFPNHLKISEGKSFRFRAYLSYPEKNITSGWSTTYIGRALNAIVGRMTDSERRRNAVVSFFSTRAWRGWRSFACVSLMRISKCKNSNHRNAFLLPGVLVFSLVLSQIEPGRILIPFVKFVTV